MCFFNNVLLFSCAAILTLRGISAAGDAEASQAEDAEISQPADAGSSKIGNPNFTPSEQHADELMLDARLSVWELLDDPNARKTIQEFFKDVKIIHEDETAAYMMVGVTQQIKDTLIDERRGSKSAMFLAHAIANWSINRTATQTIDALFKSTKRTIVDPNTPKWLNKIFDFLEACVQTHRGDELIQALVNGVCDIIEKPNTRENIVVAFKHGKELISTSMKEKIANFVVKG